MNIYFRDIDIVNIHNLPKKGGGILYGNHSNQFVDALMLVYCSPRPIRFIIAAVSYRKRIIGDFVKWIGAIPVERP